MKAAAAAVAIAVGSTAGEERMPATRADVWREWISAGVVDLVERLDRFFGDERLEDDTDVTRVRLALGARWSRAEGPSLASRFNARLALPRLHRRLQLLVDNVTEVDEPTAGGVLDQAVERSRPDAGLRYIFREGGSFRLQADGGGRLGSDPQAFVRLRARWLVPLDPWELRLSETAQWWSGDGVGLIGEMRWSRRLREGWLFRSSSRLGWYEDREGVTPAQSLAGLREAGGGQGYGLFVTGEWPETPRGGRAAYSADVLLRRRLGREWLFLEVVPGLRFAEERNYEADPRVTVLLEAQFGG